MDRFGGSRHDPATLHRYLYARDDPGGRLDPSGDEFTLTGMLTVTAIVGVVGAISGYAQGGARLAVKRGLTFAVFAAAIYTFAGLAIAYGPSVGAGSIAGGVAAGGTATAPTITQRLMEQAEHAGPDTIRRWYEALVTRITPDNPHLLAQGFRILERVQREVKQDMGPLGTRLRILLYHARVELIMKTQYPQQWKALEDWLN